MKLYVDVMDYQGSTLIDGLYVQQLIHILPELESNFRKRKSQYEDGYFDRTLIDIGLKEIESIIELDFKVCISSNTLKIYTSY
jgi:hypothetical protein